MKRSRFRLLATSCLFLALAAAHAESRPRYGGTARILLQNRITNLDPAADDDYPEARDRLAALSFETLTEIDAEGLTRPRLARSWQADSSHRFWQFRLRFANFQDGTPVTAADACISLAHSESSWKCTSVDRQTVSLETPGPVVHLAEMLALEKFAILKRQPDGALIGSGAYRLTDWQAGTRAVFAANEDYWGGRPYPDSIEVQMAASLREQLLQRQLGPYAAAEIDLEALRTLDPGGQNILLSRPADLLVIVFLQPVNSGSRPARKAIDPRIREALAASVNRSAVSTLLQRRAAPAAGLLPQWLTGYEFLMTAQQDADRARRLAAQVGSVTPIPVISLAYDFSDPTAKLVAERIQVDAGQAGIPVRPYGESHINSPAARGSINADAVLLRLSLPSLEPGVALSVLSGKLGSDSQTSAAALSAARPEDLFNLEHATLQDFHVIPVARLPEAVWLNGNAHNWQQLPNGTWDLDQLWVEGAR